ncbi:MAG: hypothetical protein GWN01_08340 [Nitrosopumilaceae archaeon]|nr:hypothetical protein [Nitrosopumilaceae archaeon]NIU87395.1 hypothetical protein [Nitrosopumilaceae archaeon]NIV65906.1 hypothetical protein [Nitrosopumilaceae archaeon]NIX61527.1 hypothetical protein [Nitrosopumilaceae archaeon]
MDKKVKQKLEQKIKETISHKDDVNEIIRLLRDVDDSSSFALGIVIGRLYNSFYYQSRRILDREPTNEEFSEFLSIIHQNKSKITKQLGL